MISRYRSYCGQAGEPVFSRANNFRAQVRQHEIDGRADGIGIGIEAQKLVGSAVRAWGVGAHAESVRDGLEVFLFFVDRFLRAPPPRLVDKWAVRGIHQPDDAVVDGAGKIGREVRDFILLAEFW